MPNNGSSMGNNVFQRNHYLFEFVFTIFKSGFTTSTAKVAGVIMQITFARFIINA